MTEALLLFGWTPDVVLNMPARRFFALMREGRKQKRQIEAARDVAACDIASIALGDSKYFETVRKAFVTRALGIEQNKPQVMDPTDPNTVKLLESLTLQASRLRGARNV